MKKTLTLILSIMYILAGNTCLAASYSYINLGDFTILTDGVKTSM